MKSIAQTYSNTENKTSEKLGFQMMFLYIIFCVLSHLLLSYHINQIDFCWIIVLNASELS